jgi:hypothetical protein
MPPGSAVTWTHAPLPLLWLELRQRARERSGVLMSAGPVKDRWQIGSEIDT